MSWLNAEANQKHTIHTRHFRCVPTPNVLVERRSRIKCTIHTSHSTTVSHVGNISIECTFTTKAFMRDALPVHPTHIRHRLTSQSGMVPKFVVDKPYVVHRPVTGDSAKQLAIAVKNMAISQIRAIGARIRGTGDGVGARKFRLKRSCGSKHAVLAPLSRPVQSTRKCRG